MPITQGEAMATITKTPPLETMEQLTAMVADLRRRRAEHGGAPLDVCFLPFGDQADPSSWAKQIRRDLPAYEDAGVTWLMIEPYSRSLSELRGAVAVMADEVLSVAD